MSTPPRSDALVFFGATGDLAYQQVFPALHAMIRHGHLDLPIIGVAKAGWTLAQLQARARASIDEHGGGVDPKAFATLTKLLRYVDGDYRERSTFERLRQELHGASRPAHYLAIPPSMFPVVIEHLGQSGCAKNARLIVEKPFGRDLASAIQLSETLHTVFDEASVFRIDHFLGKEAVQSLQYFRFANTFLEPIWNRNYVQSVQITMAETKGVQGRGSFYDEVGAIRDVVQNHLLQVVGLVAMDAPSNTYEDSARDEVAKLLRQVRPLKPDEVVRGQFRGYQREAGVAPNSNVETFAALRLWIDSWRWEGVPFFIRAGKCLPVATTEVLVELRHPPLTNLPPGQGNYLRYCLGPHLSIALGARMKRPGKGMVGDPSELVLIHQPAADEMTAYERLLGDALIGDSTLFARKDAVEAAWAVVDPILSDASPVRSYDQGTWGPAEAAQLTRDVGGWVLPMVCRDEPAPTALEAQAQAPSTHV